MKCSHSNSFVEFGRHLGHAIGRYNSAMQPTNRYSVLALLPRWRFRSFWKREPLRFAADRYHYTPPSWCFEGAIRRRGAFSTWWQRLGGACSARPYVEVLPVFQGVGIAFAWGRSSCNQALQATMGHRVVASCLGFCFIATCQSCVGPPRLNAKPLCASKNVNSSE